MTFMKKQSKAILVCFICLFGFVAHMMGQQKNITGKVVDVLNEGMPGVNYRLRALPVEPLLIWMVTSLFLFLMLNQY